MDLFKILNAKVRKKTHTYGSKNDINFVLLPKIKNVRFRMALVNEHLMKLPDKELSSEIAKRINSFQITRPKASLIHLDKNEGFHPIPASCIQAMKRAADDLSQPESFHGYCPPEGYNFLIEAVLKHEYASRGIALDSNEIFISCLLYTSPSPRDRQKSRMPSSA